MLKVAHEPCSDASGDAGGLTSFHRHLLRRLEHLLVDVAPNARQPWQVHLVAHAIRHALAECSRAGLMRQATACLRAAGRRGSSAEPELTVSAVARRTES